MIYNLVGNSCVSSYITRDILKQKFINPFVWNIFDFNSSYNLVKNWDNINFEKFKLINNLDGTFSILIDDLVKVKYVHYLYSQKDIEIRKENNDVYYNKIQDYVIGKYLSRIKLIRSVSPIFLFATANFGLDRHKPFTLYEQKLLERLDCKYPIVISFKEMISSNKLITIRQNYPFIDNGLPFSTYVYSNLRKRLRFFP